MGVTIIRVGWNATALFRTPGRWLITVTNIGNISSTFIPIEAKITSNASTVETASLTTEDHSHLRPGESMQYRLELRREGFSRFEGWDEGYFNTADENLTLELSFLGPGHPNVNQLQLQLPLSKLPLG